MALAAEGANVVLNYHSSAKGAEATVTDVKAKGGQAIAVKGDLTTEAGVAELVKTAVDAFGRVDVLVNNSGGLIARKTIAETDLDHWKSVMDLNLTSVFLMIKACLPHMPAGSTIINMASLAGRDGGGPGAIAYATSKGAVITMTRGLAKELGPNIRVNALNPGMIDTDFHNVFTKDAVRANVAAATPLKREGRSDEIGQVVAFLAGDKSSFINGACVDVNGGVAFS
jgi:3-oxoacyl-[acyl-carrier protein] reductase